jgi:hypothetical protein
MCAALRKESSMQIINATDLNRKSGVLASPQGSGLTSIFVSNRRKIIGKSTDLITSASLVHGIDIRTESPRREFCLLMNP